MKGTLPPESFRIATSTGRWFLVSISPTVEEMRDLMREHTGWCHPDQLACVVSARAAEDEAFSGIVFFAQTHMGAGIVAHELAHAAFRVCDAMAVRVEHWAGALGPDTDERVAHASEEAYCRVVETLNRAFWTEAYDRGYA